MQNKLQEFDGQIDRMTNILSGIADAKSISEVGIKLVAQPLAKKLLKTIEEKKLKKVIVETIEGRRAIRELFKYLDSENANEFTFDILRTILVKLLTGTAEFDSYSFLDIAVQLFENESRILFANYALMKSLKGHHFQGARDWLSRIAEKSGLKYPDMVENHEAKLQDLHLIAGRMHPDRSGIQKEDTARLTELGIAFCEFVLEGSLYEEFKKE